MSRAKSTQANRSTMRGLKFLKIRAENSSEQGEINAGNEGAA